MASSAETSPGRPPAPPTAVRVVPSATVGFGARRLWGLAVALAAAAVLITAALLQPAGAGIGTHEQLGLPRCGWITMADMPCPTCGMTTAFAYAADGNLIASAVTQPLGFVLAMVTAMAVFVGLYVAATGSPLLILLGRSWNGRMTTMLIAAVLLSWGYKVLVHKGVL